MKRIKIFLASSVEDLREDRLMVGDFFQQLNDLYFDSGVHFSLIKCESYDNALAVGGKQQEYDREIRESELVFFLFFRKVGDYTRHEFEVALENFRACQKPRIVTYFKYITDLEEVGQEVREFMQMLDQGLRHYYNTYGHIDTLKLGILLQIKLLKLDDSRIRLDNGAVLLNGKKVADANNIPALRGNRLLQELAEKHLQLKAILDHCRRDYLEDPTPEKETAFLDASMTLNQVSRQLTEAEHETLELLTTVAEMTVEGRVLTSRQKDALKYFNQGDYDAVHAVLEDEEREHEIQRAQQRAEAAKNEIRGYVEEEKLLIRTEIAQGLTQERSQRILHRFQKLAGLVETHDLEKTPLYAYAVFLFKHKRFHEAISVGEKLLLYYAVPNAAPKKEDEAALYSLLAVSYQQIQRFDKALEAHDKAFGLYLELAAFTIYGYRLPLADCCSQLGSLYCQIRRYGNAEQFLKKAMEMYTVLYRCDPDTHAPNLASGSMNIGLYYVNVNCAEEAEKAYLRAYELYTRLACENPAEYDVELARCCVRLGNLYLGTQPAKAEDYYRKGLEILDRLAAWNPDLYEGDLAMNLNLVGRYHYATGKDRAAEKPLERAVELYTRLAVRDPDTYEPCLAETLWNAASVYWCQGPKRKEKYIMTLQTMLPLYEKLAVIHPERFQRDAKLVAENLFEALP